VVPRKSPAPGFAGWPSAEGELGCPDGIGATGWDAVGGCVIPGGPAAGRVMPDWPEGVPAEAAWPEAGLGWPDDGWA
jgi:hypothetical protein